jgi:hypothetical protein
MAINHLVSLRKASPSAKTISICLDKICFEKISSLGFSAEYAEREDMSKQVDFGKGNYNEIERLRWVYTHKYLKEGFWVFYLDVDIVVLRDPLPFVNPEADLSIQQDGHNGDTMCIGCMLFRPSSITITITDTISSIDPPTMKWDNYQVVFNQLVKAQFRFFLKIHPLSIDFFPNGQSYFLDKRESCRKAPALIHANNMIGNQTKIEALKRENLWFI